MADRYSNLYQAPANAIAGTAPVYKGPMCESQGRTAVVYGTYTNTVAAPLSQVTADVLHLCEVTENAKLVELVIIPAADLDTDNNFTFNLGFTGALTAFAAASTGLQATAAFQPAIGTLIQAAPAPFNSNINASIKSELLLTPAAGTLEAAGVIHFIATFVTAV